MMVSERLFCTWRIALTAGLLFAFTGCVSPDLDRDDMLGWYRLPDRHYKTRDIQPDSPGNLVPIFKVGGRYFTSAYIGMEVPLTPSEEGLTVTGRVMLAGTTIGVNRETGETYISIVQEGREYSDRYYVAGETTVMTRVERPAWILDGRDDPPERNDDFIGTYQPAWYPWIRFAVKKEGEEAVYELYDYPEYGNNDQWRKIRVDGLSPHPERLGFSMPMESHLEENSIIYNHDLNRFEWLIRGKKFQEVRTPLRKVDAVEDGQQDDRPATAQVGIPFHKD